MKISDISHNEQSTSSGQEMYIRCKFDVFGHFGSQKDISKFNLKTCTQELSLGWSVVALNFPTFFASSRCLDGC